MDGKWLLSNYRVLDLTDEKGLLCGKLLADLGADVIKMEKPGGDFSRNIGPFYQGKHDPEKSLFWFAYNTNKRGITLNIESARGKKIFKRLVKRADVIIESFYPGYLEELDLGYTELSKINPKLILTSISHFGQKGPYKGFIGCDIVALAMGFMYICGDPDRSPVRISAEQAYPLAGVNAAIGSLLALIFRNMTGEGEHVDISIQECLALTMPVEIAFYEAEGYITRRSGARRRRGAIYGRDLWPCKDGHIGWRLLGGNLGAPTLNALVGWMDEEGMAGDLKNVKWETIDIAKVSQSQADEWSEKFIKFFKRHTKGELYEKAIKKRMLICPGYNTKELLEYSQLAERMFWEKVDHPELGSTFIYPGAFAKISETPCKINYRAPLIGEHNKEIFINELGFPKEDLDVLRQKGVI